MKAWAEADSKPDKYNIKVLKIAWIYEKPFTSSLEQVDFFVYQLTK